MPNVPAEEKAAYIVVGASSQIGFATAQLLLQQGAYVLATHNANDVVTAVLDEMFPGQVDRQRYDVLDADAAKPIVDRCLERWGSVRGLVYAAGKTARRPCVYQGDSDLKRILSVNFEGFHHIARACLKPTIRAHGGRIVAVGSRAGRTGMPQEALYAASKAALQAWTASVAGEVGQFGITVNVVAPGAIDIGSPAYTQALTEEVKRRTGAGRLGRPEEVAALIAFLCKDLASYVNGAVLAVDGAARY